LLRWITWAAVIGTALWAGYFFIFPIYQSLPGGSSPDNWFLRLIQEHPATTIGTAMSAITAFCLVALLEFARGPIEFDALGFKFKGASGPVILWVFCFLAMVFAVWLLWDKSGPDISQQTSSAMLSDKPLLLLTPDLEQESATEAYAPIAVPADSGNNLLPRTKLV
ncbi:MAG: hypothetical protein OQK12_11125, partial [Motiliproteus sp.]|nr:hypothetical protein [Motiliproteus sp.]